MDFATVGIILVLSAIVGLIVWMIILNSKKGCMDDKYLEYDDKAIEDTKPTSCKTKLLEADAMVQNSNTGITYYFVGTDFYEEGSDGKMSGPTDIKEKFGSNTPGFMDAAVYNDDTANYYFFKGNRIYRREGEDTDTVAGYQYNLDDKWGSNTPEGMDSAVFKQYTDGEGVEKKYYYFFKGDKYYRKTAGVSTGPAVPIGEGWGGLSEAIAGNMNAAAYNKTDDMYTYVSGDDYFLRKAGEDINMADYPKSLTTLLIST